MIRSETRAQAQDELQAATPPDEITRIRPETGWVGLNLAELWAFRELLYFLAWRDLKVRYKQTVLGFAWAVVPPISRVLVFSLIFGKFAGLPSEVPYPLAVYIALLPWSLFAGAVNRAGGSMVSSAGLISKVYFPRLVVPLSAVIGAVIDFLISLSLVGVLMAYYGFAPGWTLLTLPLWTFLVILLGLGVGMGLAAANVRYRDITYLMGFLLEIWMYASPVVYEATIVKAPYREWYDWNPLVGLILGFRWALLGDAPGGYIPWAQSALLITVVFVAAAAYFTRVERSFADVI